jgi:diaminopimelate epimerase
VIGRPTGQRWPVEIHNADGSVAESCGNGARCVVRHILDRRGLEACELATAGGIVHGRREGDLLGIALTSPRVLGSVSLDGRTALRVDVGNPHVVVFGEEPRRVDLRVLAGRVRAAAADANVEAAHVRSRSEIDVRVDERGVGETLACGTGACAAVAAALSIGGVDGAQISVTLPGGTLVLRPGPQRYELRGPAERVYEGTTA